MDVLLAALLVSMAVWSARRLWRWSSRRQFERRRAASPGFSADRPLVLKSARTLDDTIAQTRCSCGGALRSIGETPRLGLRVARLQCRTCEDELELYFVLPSLLN